MNARMPVDQTASLLSGSPLDPFDIIGSCLAVQQAWLLQPERMATIIQSLMLDISRVHERLVRTRLGCSSEPAVATIPYDERFQDPVWIHQPRFSYLKEIYLLYSRWLEDAIHTTWNVEPGRRQRAAFWTRQWLDAIAPTNYFWSNPEALQRSVI